ncbi:hypothetical protein T492DRAFT_840395 [Pavlovales sp. CCMP2436]|nr:hypothetical protein T492DRAFT_840395 [Pavlovales sp. CCMP2436]
MHPSGSSLAVPGRSLAPPAEIKSRPVSPAPSLQPSASGAPRRPYFILYPKPNPDPASNPTQLQSSYTRVQSRVGLVEGKVLRGIMRGLRVLVAPTLTPAQARANAISDPEPLTGALSVLIGLRGSQGSPYEAIWTYWKLSKAHEPDVHRCTENK